MDDLIFHEFPDSSKEDWLRQTLQNLKSKGTVPSLGANLWDRVSLQPLYAAEDLPTAVHQRRFNPPSEFPGMPPRIWSNVVTVVPGDSNTEVLYALENGAEGLVLPLFGSENLEELLAGVIPDYISIYLLPLGNPIHALQAFLDWVDRRDLTGEALSGGILWSPSDLVFDQNGDFGLGVEVLGELMELAKPYPAFKAFCIKTSRYRESGAHPLDALVFGFGELVEILDKSFLSPEEVFANLFLESSVADPHFGEIARQLAFRQVFREFAAMYQVEVAEEDVQLFCQTSHWSKSLLDAHTNLIRQTYEAMSAILGGATQLWVKPLDEDNCSAMERRIARNVSSILREEAYLDKVQDPAAGSYFLEKLTSELVQHLQEGLSKLEEEGGWWQACKAGEIQRRVKNHRALEQGRVLEGVQKRIGVNAFQAPTSLAYNKDLTSFEEAPHALKPSRASYLVECLTLDPS